MKINIFFSLCFTLSILHGMETEENAKGQCEQVFLPPDKQEEVNNNLLNYTEEHNLTGIMQSLCDGADKNIKDSSNQSLQKILYLKSFIILDGKIRPIVPSNKHAKCKNALDNYPEQLMHYFEEIDKGNLSVSVTPPIWLSLGIVNGIDYKHDTALHKVLQGGENNDDIVKKLIGKRNLLNRYPKGIDSPNDDGDTPLHLVMKTEREDESRRRLCLFLVSRGADAGIQNKEGKMPMTIDHMFWIKLLDYGNMPIKKGWGSSCLVS